MSKQAVLDRLRAERLIALLQADSATDLATLATGLQRGRISSLEIPLTCPAMPDFLAEIADSFPRFQFGLGTVIDTETARRGILAGARFISTPALRAEVILLCRRHQIPVICGVHSPEEMDGALLAGADAVKLYPSEDQFGPTHVRQVRAQFPEALIFPVGGVTADNVTDFLDAGADAVFVASFLRDPDDQKPLAGKSIYQRARALTQVLDPAPACPE